ncbi:MAG: hypothetical protein CO098_09530 [Bacteroidetes bacterium CG_4_9_14_3_um_filter_41_19]|nr:MAG: hypothetical protein CO098_09530 [Bacteroidetes bacterium CG_4_9_14_3_um_filter_41_19]
MIDLFLNVVSGLKRWNKTSLPAAGKLVTAALKRGREGDKTSSLPLRSNEDERGDERGKFNKPITKT